MKKIADLELKHRYIEQHQLDNWLSPEILEVFALQEFDPGEFIYYQNEVAHTFYILVEGKLQVDFLLPNGRQTILSVSEPPSVIGDLELFETFPVVRNAITLERSRLFAVAIDTMRELGQYDPLFLRFIIHHIVKKIDASSKQLVQTSLSLESRLAHYLLNQAGQRGRVLKLERRDVLAGRLGTSVRHLNRTLKTFVQQGTITLHYRTLEITDPATLSKIAHKQ